jgi:hypothetical protein
MWLIVDGDWNGNLICCILKQLVTKFFSTLLHTHTRASIHSHVFTFRCLVTASNFGCFSFSRFPYSSRPRLPVSNFSSSQRLNRNSSVIHSLTQTNSPHSTDFLTCPALIFWYGPHRKHRYFLAVPLLSPCLLRYSLLHPVLVVELFLSHVLAEPLPSIRCFIVSHFAVVA